MVCRLRDMGSAPLSVGYARISSCNQIKNYRPHLFQPSQYFWVLLSTSDYWWVILDTCGYNISNGLRCSYTTKLRTAPNLSDEGPDYSAL